MGGVWMRTHRAWGGGRTIRGVAHYMVDGVALCGYVPNKRTTVMVPEVRTGRLLDHDRCLRCVSREKHSDE